MSSDPDFGKIHHARRDSRVALDDLFGTSALLFHRSNRARRNTRALENRLAANHALHAVDDLIRFPERLAARSQVFSRFSDIDDKIVVRSDGIRTWILIDRIEQAFAALRRQDRSDTIPYQSFKRSRSSSVRARPERRDNLVETMCLSMAL